MDGDTEDQRESHMDHSRAELKCGSTSSENPERPQVEERVVCKGWDAGGMAAGGR